MLLQIYQPKVTLAALSWKKTKKTPTKPVYETSSNSSKTTVTLSQNYSYYEPSPPIPETYESRFEQDHVISEDTLDDFGSPTPPISRNGYYSRSRSRTPLNLSGSLNKPCKAKTRVGTPCKLHSLPGRDFCHKHQLGDSLRIT